MSWPQTSSVSVSALGLAAPAIPYKQQALAFLDGPQVYSTKLKRIVAKDVPRSVLDANRRYLRGAWRAADDDAAFVLLGDAAGHAIRWSDVPVDGGIMDWPADIPKFSSKDRLVSRVRDDGEVVAEFVLSGVVLNICGTLSTFGNDVEGGYVTLRKSREFEIGGCAICKAKLGDLDYVWKSTPDDSLPRACPRCTPLVLSPKHAQYDGRPPGRGVGVHYYMFLSSRRVRWMDLANCRILCEMCHAGIASEDMSFGQQAAAARRRELAAEEEKADAAVAGAAEEKADAAVADAGETPPPAESSDSESWRDEIGDELFWAGLERIRKGLISTHLGKRSTRDE